MKNINEIEDNINELILQKSFDKLTPEEKEKALAHAGGEEEYNSLRATLLAITSSFSAEEEVSVDQELKSDLMDQFTKKFGNAGDRVKVIPLYRKPFFQLAVAASVAVMIFFAFPFLNDSNKKDGQLAMTTDKSASSGETVTLDEKNVPDLSLESEDASGKDEKTVAANALKQDQAPLEESKNLGETGPMKDLNTATPIIDNVTESRLDDLADKKEDLRNEGDKDKAADTKSVPGNTNSKAVLAKEKDEKADDFMYERVMRERKEAERSKGKKKEEAKKASTEKTEDADISYESVAAGAISENAPMSPAKITITNSVNTFLEEKKTEILDLLFTTF